MAAYRPISPGRTELEAILREIGRGAVTPEMVDRAWLLTRPQFHWYANVNDIRQNLADSDFKRLVDQAAHELTAKPAETLPVFYGAVYFRPDSEIGYIKSLLEEFIAVAGKPVVPVRGTVVDSRAGRPIAGALVYSEDAMTRTDAAGAFQLQAKSTRPKGMIWIEAEGYALGEYAVLDGPAKPDDVRIALRPRL